MGSRKKRRAVRWVAALLLAACANAATGAGTASSASADSMEALKRLPAPQRERYVKAGFVVNFAKFTEWPADAFADARSPFRLCILGRDPFGEALDGLQRKTVRGRPLAVEHLIRIGDARKCHLLFISASARGRLAQILPTLEGSSTLTVSDIPDFLRSGGMIGLRNVRNRIRFDANPPAARNVGLTISSRLLRLVPGARHSKPTTRLSMRSR